MIAATYDDVVFQSTDRGECWHEVDQGFTIASPALWSRAISRILRGDRPLLAGTLVGGDARWTEGEPEPTCNGIAPTMLGAGRPVTLVGAPADDPIAGPGDDVDLGGYGQSWVGGAPVMIS